MNNLSRLQSIALAIVVTIIWSFSWVLIKFGLQDDIPPLTFAGLRYSIAALILVVFTLASQDRRQKLKQINPSNLLSLTLLGLFFYTATQGLVFLSLDYLPAATFSLLLNFTPVVVMIGGVLFLQEIPNRSQYLGLALFLLGTIIYFIPTPQTLAIGLLIGVATMFANAISSLLGRAINRRLEMDAFIVTVVSMGIGASLLLTVGLLLEGIPTISVQGWMIILWLASVHTALAFTLWNITLRVLSASESSIINNTMLVQTAVLAWLFLGEALSARQVLALIIASIGIVVFQLRKTSVRKSV
ncbi:MAG: DMT family transporter [Phototrophicaceae bacterium]